MKPSPLRTSIGLLSLAGLAGLALWVQAGKADEWPALVVAEQTFRLSGVEPGRYAWVVEDGRVALGHGLVSQRSVVFERNDPVSLEIAPGLQSGTRVQAGQPLAQMRSTLLEEQARTLEAERAVVKARRDLLVAGARPEAVESARKALAVARAMADGARPERSRAEQLVAQGAGSSAELETAALNERVQGLEAELAAARLAEIRASARPEEIAAMDAELSAIEARLDAMQARLSQTVLSAPIDGVLSLGQVLELSGDTTVLRVQDTDPVVLRIPLPQHSRGEAQVGHTLRFRTRAVADRDFQAKIIAISEEALPLNGQQIFWMAATIDNADGALQPGVSGWVTRGTAQ